MQMCLKPLLSSSGPKVVVILQHSHCGNLVLQQCSAVRRGGGGGGGGGGGHYCSHVFL